MRKWLLAASVAALGVAPAHSQIVSVYGMFTPQHLTNVETGSVYTNGSGYSEQYTSFWAPAFGGGVTFNFLNVHVVKLGLDVRGSSKPGTTGADTAQVGLRLGFQPPILKIKPYVQAGAGYLGTRTANVTTTAVCTGSVISCTTGAVGGTFTNKYATYGIQGGVDTPLAPFFDWRVVEVGVTHGFNVGISSSSSNATMFSVATGLVFRF